MVPVWRKELIVCSPMKPLCEFLSDMCGQEAEGLGRSKKG